MVFNVVISGVIEIFALGVACQERDRIRVCSWHCRRWGKVISLETQEHLLEPLENRTEFFLRLTVH